MPEGEANSALVAAKPSPEKPEVPVPAIVEMTPVDAATNRMRLLPVSAMYRLPEESTATALGKLSTAAVARHPSPTESVEEPQKGLLPPPATVLI